MISQNIQTTIQEHMKRLPRTLQEAIHASSWERKILNIGRKHGLHVDQLEILQTELSLAVLGLIPRDEFVREVAREAEITKENMSKIIEDINSEIFAPIREYLKEHMEPVGAPSQEQTSETLDMKERATLKRHGVSFEDDEDEEVYTPSTSFSQTVSTPTQQSNQLDKDLSSFPPPSSAPQQPTPKDIEIRAPETKDFAYLEDDEEEETETLKEKTNKETQINEESNDLRGSVIDPTSLQSAKTQEHQNTIKSASGGYQNQDPYREPIE